MGRPITLGSIGYTLFDALDLVAGDDGEAGLPSGLGGCGLECGALRGGTRGPAVYWDARGGVECSRPLGHRVSGLLVYMLALSGPRRCQVANGDHGSHNVFYTLLTLALVFVHRDALTTLVFLLHRGASGDLGLVLIERQVYRAAYGRG